MAVAAQRRWVSATVIGLLFVVGVLGRGPIAAIALIAVTVVVALLVYAAWPRASAIGKIARLLIIVAMLAVAVHQALR